MQNISQKPATRILQWCTNFYWYLQWVVLAIVVVAIIAVTFVPAESIQTFFETEVQEEDLDGLFSAIREEQVLLAEGETEFIEQSGAVTDFLRWYPANVKLLAFFFMLGALVVLSVSLLITQQLRFIFDSLKQNEVFTMENAERIRKISVYLFAYIGLNVLFFFEFSFSTLMFALLVLVLSEIFKRGTELEEEKKLIV